MQLPIPIAPTNPKGKGKGKAPEGVPPVPPAAATPAAAVSGVSSQGAEGQLAALVSALASCQETLPERVRELLHVQQGQSASLQAKALHRHVSAQASAAKQLASLRQRRDKYLQDWRTYVHALGDSFKKHLEEKSNILAGFDSEEAVLLETIEEAKERVVSLAGREHLPEGGNEMDVAKDETCPEDRLQMQQKEQALLKAVEAMKEDADREVRTRQRDGSRTPRRAGKEADAVSISSEDGLRPPNSFG